MKLLKKYLMVLTIAVVLITQSCQQPGGDTTGSEFMPDMAHSVAYEANYYNYYYNNTWGSEADYHKYAMPKKPVKGTIPRQSATSISIPSASGSQPYYYGDTEEERTRAIAEIIDNPFPITDEGLARGKELYDIFCGICHGDKGDGNGYIARDDGAYPVAPAQLINEEFTASSNGRFYHSIMYGKNLMGSYKDKISYEERWQVIHYIRSLQAKGNKLTYNQFENTLNNVDRPAGVIRQMAMSENVHDENSDDEHDGVNEGDHHSHSDHDSKEHDHEGGSHDHDGHEHH